ncbi:M15 family metallopeptidase [Aureitalea marina]|uniref:D-alanyl-D-alanine carboxypeptidase n=1 Tax=Aureitalea marina TaxID=930804 RepID=A0A2S7KMB3_9FLAO|nr:M15 family metallopeptidase [Aureitalea marina]PQB03742.1 D-alanyl-D-alanine carboxypeptidase [Aureitalea marina]
MNRRDFLGFSIAGLIGIHQLHASGTSTEQLDRNMLIGKTQDHLIGTGFKLHKEVKPAFDAMVAAASNEGIKIEVVSAFRSFHRQKQIFEGKYLRYTEEGLNPQAAIDKIIEYSTIPGTSRHHWGTDIDLIDASAPRPESVLKARHFHGEGPFCKFKEWMDKHAERFGFYEVYTDKADRKGFKYEPWHFSYAAVSIDFLKAYLDLDLRSILQEEAVLGSAHFTEDFIQDYRNQHILDINPALL